MKQYCVFCASGKERITCLHLEGLTGGEAISPRVVCHISRQGVWEDYEYGLLPGYVFLFLAEGEESLPVAKILKLPDVLKILHYDQGQYELRGADAAFARWLRQNDGVIGKSTAVREGERIRVVDGPMRQLFTKITKVNKQRRRAQVEFSINGVPHVMWMAFDWADQNE